MAETALSTKAIGSIVKIKENGAFTEFLVLQHGYPAAGRTLLVRNYVHSQIKWNVTYDANSRTGGNDYAASVIDSWMNSTYLNTIDTEVRNQIIGVNIAYTTARSYETRTLNRKVFLLSATEVGYVSDESNGFFVEGQRLSYFNSKDRQKAYPSAAGAATSWWLRTPGIYSEYDWVYRISSLGSLGYWNCMGLSSARPAFTLPSTIKISDSGEVVTNTAPTPPTALTLPATIRSGASFAISWAGATDPQNNLQGYNLERSLNGGSTWAQIYQGAAASTTDTIAYGAATLAIYRVRSYDIYGLTSAWYTSASKTVVNNTAPAAPPSITVPAAVTGGAKLTVTWAAATDREGNISGYQLERSVAGAAYAQIYTGTALSFADTVTKGWATVAYRVRCYDAYSEYSPYTTSPVRTVDNNTPPTITCGQSGNIGSKSAGFTIAYTVADADKHGVTVTEKIDNVVKRTFAAALGVSNNFAVTGTTFMQLLNGGHTMTITAVDAGGKSAVHTITFTKAVHSLKITLSQPMATDAMITKMVMNLVRSIPADAVFTVDVTNNAKDTAVVWERITDNIVMGRNHLFTNTRVQNGHAFNFLIQCSRGASGQGGFISSIGGAFE